MNINRLPLHKFTDRKMRYDTMKKYNRIFVIVLDSLGIGAMPDSERFGDIDVDTFGHILEDADSQYPKSYKAWNAQSAPWRSDETGG